MNTRRPWTSRSLNQKLGIAALALGLLGIGAKTDRGHVVALDTRELAAILDREADHVGAEELAGWIVAGRSDYRLIDLRREDEYARYHIPTAENVTLTRLPDAGLLANEKVVLYSEGGIHAAQAWMLMRARGMRSVYTLKGGLDQWKDEVLFPVLAEDATAAERERFERSAALARSFGGEPRTGGAGVGAVKPPEMPKVASPPAPAAVGSRPAKKKKEGC